MNVDNFAIIPNSTYQRVYGVRVARIGRLGTILNIQISVVPRDGVSAETAMAEVQQIMRSRHGLKLDQPDDFDLFTQDSILKLFDRVSQATFFALIVISSIALMVGGIGVMAIMSISVTERTREIGVRKALGARRAEILFQFLMEAAFLTSLGGVLGSALGSGIGLAGPPGVRLPGVAPLVVIRHRHRILGLRGHLFRPVSRIQGLSPRPDRRPPLRIITDHQPTLQPPGRVDMMRLST